jgi:hypothetical protein
MVAELLVKVDMAQHGNYLAELQKRFFTPVFDLRASAVAASLWLKHRGLPKDEQIARQTLKSDVLIVATALVAGAKVYYSNDSKCRRFADLAGMKGQNLPTHHTNMHRDADIRRGVNL